MNKYIYFISFILISTFFSGCYDKTNISSFDNKTEDSSAVSTSSIKAAEDNFTIISNNISSSKKDTIINNTDNEKVNADLYSADNNTSAEQDDLQEDLTADYKDTSHKMPVTDHSVINNSISGTYKIIFFGSQVVNVYNSFFGNIVDMYYISNDCKKAQKLYPDIVNNGIKNQCNLLTQSKILDGIITIAYNKNNQINIISRLQMEGGIIDNSQPDKYQYTIYSPITDIITLQGRGITNWNYNTLTNSPAHLSKSYNESPFQLTMLDDGFIRIDMTLMKKTIKAVGKDITIDTANTIIIKKISSEYTELENKVQKKFSRK